MQVRRMDQQGKYSAIKPIIKYYAHQGLTSNIILLLSKALSLIKGRRDNPIGPKMVI
jgi:hypothetical protein